MNKWREELIEKMVQAMGYIEPHNNLMIDELARAALAVVEPVIREQCAKIVDELAKEYRLYSRHFPYAEDAEQVATAIREGGKDG